MANGLLNQTGLLAPRMNRPVGNYSFQDDTLIPYLQQTFSPERWRISPFPSLEDVQAIAAQKQVPMNDMIGTAMDAVNPMAKIGGLLGTVYKYGIPRQNITVMDPLRAAFPGIYENPKEIAKAAAKNTAEENPAMRQLFGVSRDDLYELHKGKVGNEAPKLPGAANKPTGSTAAKKVKNPKNTQRIIDVLSEAGNYPELYKGMDSWYEMQPLFDRLQQISDDPASDFVRFQSMTGMASPGSDVLTEINRGTAALHLANQGRFHDFLRHGGKEGQIPGLPGVAGHPYHSTAQGIPMQSYLETGLLGMKSPKVPLYIQSAGVPETGFQTKWPVGDAHWSRGVGLADVRTNKNPGASVTMSELQTLGPWWEKKIADQLGINSVDAQARAWGTFAPATGVDTPVGAPKLELISQKIMDAAKAYNISPEQARDMLLKGEIFAPNLNLLGQTRLSR